MRRRTFFLIISLAIFTWAIFTYYLFLQRPQGKVFRSGRLHDQLDNLEKELQRLLNSNEDILLTLRNLKNKVSEGGKSIEILLANGSVFNTGFNKFESNPVIAVLVFACNRVTVKRSLDQLLNHRPSQVQFPIIVSQDCNHEPTTRAIKSYGDKLTLIQHPDQSDIPLSGKERKFKGYYKIARHYGWALNKTFHDFNYDTVIIVEDDLDIAPDFFEYFLALYPILKHDPTLWCVSAWNDNGKENLVENNPELLYRSDFFPGLGWMLTKDLWSELETKWPKAFWDDWIRQPAQRRDRACIRPEVSRTKTFGKIGVSNGLFFEKHLKFIKLNDKFVPFTKKNLSYLKKDNYDVAFVKEVYGSPAVTFQQLQKGSFDHQGPVRYTYRSREIFKKAARALGLMDDFKSGVPRAGYRGVVSFMYKGRRVYLAPPADWKGYNISWT